MSLIGRLVDKLLKQGSITLLLPGKRPQTCGSGGGRHLNVRFTDRKVAFDIVRNPALGFGEAYMEGRVLIEDGTILDLLELIVGANRWEDAGADLRALRGTSGLKRLLSRNTLKRARRNVAHHYDLRDELYELFLDDDRQYSCAYFTDPGNGLDQAQADKKAHIAAKLALEPGQRVLDIGCGWGGMALYLHQVAGVDVLGVTLSERQLKIARERAKAAGVSAHVKFELTDYRLLDDRFDRIVSVGMFEHVGRKHYDEFFAKCRELLKPEGVMLVHTIGLLGEPASGPDAFTDKWIFPGYHLPALSEMLSASERARLIASDVETLRLHYALTLRHWLERATRERGKIEAMYDARFFRMWEYYLASGIVMFESGAACNYQVQYIRDRTALPITRDYMAQVEARYRSASRPARAAAKPRSPGRKKVAFAHRRLKAAQKKARRWAPDPFFQFSNLAAVGLTRPLLAAHLFVGLLALLLGKLAVMIEVGAIEMLKRDLLCLGGRHAAVLVDVGHFEHPASHAVVHAGFFHPRLHLPGEGIKLGTGDGAILVGVSAREQPAERGCARLRRLSALCRETGIARRLGFGLGDLAIAVGIETVEHLATVEPLRAPFHSGVALAIRRLGFRLGNEAVTVGVEPREHALDLRLHVGSRFGLHRPGGAGDHVPLAARVWAIATLAAITAAAAALPNKNLLINILLKNCEEGLAAPSCRRVEWAVQLAGRK